MKKLILKGLALLVTAVLMGNAQASLTQAIAWTSAETSQFTAAPNESKSFWTGNTLTLSYDRQLVNGASWNYATSGGGGEPTLPSLWSKVAPVDMIGLRFDFSHTGYFESAQVGFGYYLPNKGTGFGGNSSYQAYTLIDQYQSIDWTPSGTSDSPSLNLVKNGAVTTVDIFFSPDMLKYLDGFLGIGFTARGYGGSTDWLPDFSGSATFANVSWLASEGSSANVNRWHVGDPVDSGGGNYGGSNSSVPEPETYVIVLTALVLLSWSAKYRKQKLSVAGTQSPPWGAE